MFRILRVVSACALIAVVVWFAGIAQDKHTLQQELIRLHVVADSDSEDAQRLKLQVKDAVVAALEEHLGSVESAAQAKELLSGMLDEVQEIAKEVLASAGVEETVRVTLEREAFDTREYDTFTLPAGVYESLRIVIGDGEGKNWWCVVFPGLCLPATVKEFETEAAGAGFSDTLTETVRNDEKTEIRFWILDVWGRIENFFHR